MREFDQDIYPIAKHRSAFEQVASRLLLSKYSKEEFANEGIEIEEPDSRSSEAPSICDHKLTHILDNEEQRYRATLELGV